MKIQVFWNITLWQLVNIYRRFEAAWTQKLEEASLSET